MTVTFSTPGNYIVFEGIGSMLFQHTPVVQLFPQLETKLIVFLVSVYSNTLLWSCCPAARDQTSCHHSCDRPDYVPWVVVITPVS